MYVFTFLFFILCHVNCCTSVCEIINKDFYYYYFYYYNAYLLQCFSLDIQKTLTKLYKRRVKITTRILQYLTIKMLFISVEVNSGEYLPGPEVGILILR